MLKGQYNNKQVLFLSEKFRRIQKVAYRIFSLLWTEILINPIQAWLIMLLKCFISKFLLLNITQTFI